MTYNVTADSHPTPARSLPAVSRVPSYIASPSGLFAALLPRDGVLVPSSQLAPAAAQLVTETGEHRALALTAVVARANMVRARQVHAYGMTELATFHVAQARNAWRMHRLVREL